MVINMLINIFQFQLKCNDLMPLFVIYDNKVFIFISDD